MEKLDKQYKRNGKTITHRVVCEKIQIKKMKGGIALNAENFKIIGKKLDGDFGFDTFWTKPCIFFKKNLLDFEYAIFNKSHINQSVGIARCMNGNVTEVTTFDKELLNELQKLKIFLNKNHIEKFKSIQKFLNDKVGNISQPVGNISQLVGNTSQPVGNISQPVGNISQLVGNTSQ
jgi:hypothetical protein